MGTTWSVVILAGVFSLMSAHWAARSHVGVRMRLRPRAAPGTAADAYWFASFLTAGCAAATVDHTPRYLLVYAAALVGVMVPTAVTALVHNHRLRGAPARGERRGVGA